MIWHVRHLWQHLVWYREGLRNKARPSYSDYRMRLLTLQWRCLETERRQMPKVGKKKFPYTTKGKAAAKKAATKVKRKK